MEARRETRPVVQVDKVYRAVGRYDGVAAVYMQSQKPGCLCADVAQYIFLERNKSGSPVYAFVSELVESLTAGVTPIKKGLASMP